MKKNWNLFTDKFGTTILHPQYLINKYLQDSLNESLKYATQFKKPNILSLILSDNVKILFNESISALLKLIL